MLKSKKNLLNLWKVQNKDKFSSIHPRSFKVSIFILGSIWKSSQSASKFSLKPAARCFFTIKTNNMQLLKGCREETKMKLGKLKKNLRPVLWTTQALNHVILICMGRTTCSHSRIAFLTVYLLEILLKKHSFFFFTSVFPFIPQLSPQVGSGSNHTHWSLQNRHN